MESVATSADMTRYRKWKFPIKSMTTVHNKLQTMKHQLNIRTARFLQKFNASQDSLCSLFQRNAKIQMCDIFRHANCNAMNVSLFCNAVYDSFLGRTA